MLWLLAVFFSTIIILVIYFYAINPPGKACIPNCVNVDGGSNGCGGTCPELSVQQPVKQILVYKNTPDEILYISGLDLYVAGQTEPLPFSDVESFNFNSNEFCRTGITNCPNMKTIYSVELKTPKVLTKILVNGGIDKAYTNGSYIQLLNPKPVVNIPITQIKDLDFTQLITVPKSNPDNIKYSGNISSIYLFSRTLPPTTQLSSNIEYFDKDGMSVLNKMSQTRYTNIGIPYVIFTSSNNTPVQISNIKIYPFNSTSFSDTSVVVMDGAGVPIYFKKISDPTSNPYIINLN